MHVLLAYDGSPASRSAIDAGAQLFPRARATVVHFWTPPFAGDALRRRLRERADTADDLREMLEAEAQRLVGTGAVLAAAAGWETTPLVRRSFGGDGFRLAALAGELHPDVAVVGSRGLRGMAVVLDSTTDLLVHHASVPVLVVPHPLLTEDRERLPDGPVVVGWDGSDGAACAMAAVGPLFPGRRVVSLAVGRTEPAPVPVAGVTSRTSPPASPFPGPARAVARELLAGARKEGAAVLAVGSRGRSALREVLLGSTATAVLHHAHLPVVVVPQAVTGGPP